MVLGTLGLPSCCAVYFNILDSWIGTFLVPFDVFISDLAYRN